MWHVPTVRRRYYRWRAYHGKDFASDAAYGHLDGDDLPDVPVGRLPVRSQDELRLQIAKIKRYEQRPPTIDDLRIVNWQGSAQYGQTNDILASLLANQVLDVQLPPVFDAWIICSHHASPFCGHPPDQPMRFIEAMRRRQKLVQIAQMVLPELPGSVTMRFQQLGKGGIFILQALFRPRHTNCQ